MPASLGALLVFAAVVGGILYLTGSVPERIFVYLGLAAACVLVASLAWEIVVREVLAHEARSREEGAVGMAEGPPGALAWVAFPVAIFLSLASLPFLVLVVYPPAEELFTESGRVTASVSRGSAGLLLHLDFPEPTMQRGENLRINGTPLPQGYVRDHPEVFVWRGGQTLSLAVEPLLRDLRLERIDSVGINQLSGAPRFTYQSGRTVPQQRVMVKPGP